MERYEEIERSIQKKFKKTIWHRFIGGVKDYQLIAENDRIAVCLSGGKDSMLLAKCLQLLQAHSERPFSLEFIIMDPGYSADDRDKLLRNAELLHIPAKVFDSDIFDVAAKSGGSPCYLCARMRRGYLYKYAASLGCNKIALGHHFDDMIETTLMSMLYAAQVQTMMPKLHSTHFEGMELIRPLYMVREADISAWKRYNGLEFLHCACPLADKRFACGEGGSKRQEVKELVAALRKTNPQIDINIFRSMHNVNLNTVIGYQQGDEKHSFLETY